MNPGHSKTHTSTEKGGGAEGEKKEILRGEGEIWMKKEGEKERRIKTHINQI